MEIVLLGTSSGVPTKTRNVSALAIKADDGKRWYLVDCGEGTQHRLLHTGLSLTSLAGVFITHVHGDHCYGLPGLLASAAMAGRKQSLPVVGPSALQSFIAAVQISTSLQLNYALQFTATETLPEIPLPDFRVQVAALSHRVPSYAYAFIENPVPGKLDRDKLLEAGIPPGPLWGKLQHAGSVETVDGRLLSRADFLLAPAKPRKIVVGGDNDRPELLTEYCRDADVLIHEATYTADVIAKVGAERQHSSAAQVAAFAAAVEIPNLILTHFSPRYRSGPADSPSLRDIETEARRYYSGNLMLAKDFDSYRLQRDGALLKIERKID